ncbi:OprD family porin [Pseudomonas sp. gcc21]|uniref:OprD family porin n=1 Tax=Pseudomonas sp. gcc21 TaxID=2726989 RepID=UPI0014527755|nr:OprD family porin [Pseudomonas sp. gcc21]QJD59318.1 OprD family porin [Pseudomonas sp. gcc21]
MSYNKARFILMGMLASAPAMAAQTDAEGFVEGSTLDLFLRNGYISRDYKQGNQDKAEWGQGAVASFSSGFTKGTVGFGVDAFGMYGVRLDSGNGRAGHPGIDFFMVDDNGDIEHDVAHAGAALKARVSNTVISYGDQRPTLPVLSHDNSRLLPETFTGTLITSAEIEGLVLHAGRFTAESRKSDEGRDSAALKAIDVLGGRYQFNENISASLYASDVEDVLKRQYINLNYVRPLDNGDSLTLDFGGYRTNQEKEFDPTEGKNRIWSLAATYETGPHDFTLAYQRSSGDVGYNYGYYQNLGGVGDGGTTIWLANSYWSDFNNEDERSWQVAYGLDFAEYGVPGLSYKVAYVRGTDINLDAAGRGTEREFFNQFQYVVQSGAAKDLSVRLRSSALRVSSNAQNAISEGNEVRVFVDFPLDIL